MTSAPELDMAKAEAFGGKVMGLINGWAAAMCLSVGHRTELFDTMAGLAPSSSQQIADAAGLDERYVREWLHTLVVAGVIEYDREAKTYVLPPEHAAALTRAAGPHNAASMTTMFSMLSGVEDELVEAFKTGAGIPYSSFPRFAEFMAEDSALRFDHGLVDAQVPLVPGIVAKLEAGIEVADMGCGSGHAINVMAKHWPNSRFTGFDFSEEAIGRAREEAHAWELPNATFGVQDVSKLDLADRFDLITTFDAVHDQADPAGMLASVHSALKPGGTYLCADIAASSEVADNMEHPIGAFGYTISLFHCMSVSLAQGGEGLGAMWGEQKAREMFADAGLRIVAVEQVEGDFLNNYYIATKD
jgi:SAM-dependent methyltransferase